MLPKAHLTSCFKISDARWVITLSWLSGSLRPFLYSFLYSCYLLIFLLLLGPYFFCHFIVPIFAWNVHLVFLIFLTKSLVFPILLFSCISLHCSLKKAFLLLAILWNSAFKWVHLSFSPLPLAYLLFSAICKASSDNLLAFLYFFFLGMVLITASCIVSPTKPGADCCCHCFLCSNYLLYVSLKSIPRI